MVSGSERVTPSRMSHKLEGQSSHGPSRDEKADAQPPAQPSGGGSENKDAPPSPRTNEHHHGSALGLALAALGIVFGDIGTSPLYALKECVNGSHGVEATTSNVLGLLSLMFWSVLSVVSYKYLTFIMRADNQGEGGILALLALLPESRGARPAKLTALVALVLFGAALLYGDGMLTPAISVLSAVEGLEVATDTFKPAVVPITVGILIALFAIQKRGTDSIGKVFGPIMVLWFVTLAGLGILAITKHPGVLVAISPIHAVSFFQQNGFHGFVVLGAVVLCITGGEALYADMGHFGRKPIQLAWYGVAMPALLLNYFGQGALIIAADEAVKPTVVANPFYALAPSAHAIYPLVALATAATIIASQALISGAFSLTRQAVQLGFLPRVTITHTSSTTEGQIYIPEINWLLAIGCLALVLAFKQSSNLAAAYGIAVTGTMAITSIAYYVVARERWKWSRAQAVPLVATFLLVDLAFLGSNALKFFHGGFVPVVIAIGIFFAMTVWKRGRALLGDYFQRAARPLETFLSGLGKNVFVDEGSEAIQLVRVQGAAVFLTSNSSGTPPLLLHHARHNKAIQEHVLLVTVVTERIPRITKERLRLEPLEHGFYRLNIRVGFMETPNVPRALAVAIKAYKLPFELKQVTYYLGRETLLATSRGEMTGRAEAVFSFLTRNSQNATRYFGIPPERVVEIGMQIDL